MLVEDIDAIGAKPLEGFFDDHTDAFRPAIQADFRPAILEAEFRRDHHLITDRRQRLADEILVGEWPVGLCRVEEGHAPVMRRPQERNGIAALHRRPAMVVQPHAAETDRRYVRASLAELAFDHADVLLRFDRNLRAKA